MMMMEAAVEESKAPSPETTSIEESVPMKEEDSKVVEEVVRKRDREDEEEVRVVVRRTSCEPSQGVVDDAPLVEPDASEVRLLQLVDGDGGLLLGSGEKASQLATKLNRGVTKAVFLAILRESRADPLSQFVESGGLRSLGKWLVEDDDEELGLLVLKTLLAPVPVTKRAIRSSGIGKIVKRLREGSSRMSEMCAKIMDDWVKSVGDERVEEPTKQQQSSVIVVSASSKPLTSDPLASALTKTKSNTTRIERAEARRSGRGGGVQQISDDKNDDDDDDGEDRFDASGSSSFGGGDRQFAPLAAAPVVPQSRPFNKALGDLLERARLREESQKDTSRRKRVRWADENSAGELVEKREPVPGWLDVEVNNVENMSLRERNKREHEAEKKALEEAKKEAAVARELAAKRRLEALRAMKKTRNWTRPQALSGLPRPEDFSLDSPEASKKQPKRIERLIEARYLHPRDIPKSPNEQDPDLLAGHASFDLATIIPLDEETAKTLSAATTTTPTQQPTPLPTPQQQPQHQQPYVGTAYPSSNTTTTTTTNNDRIGYYPNTEELSNSLLLLSSDDLEKIMTDPTLVKPDGSFRDTRLVFDAIEQALARRRRLDAVQPSRPPQHDAFRHPPGGGGQSRFGGPPPPRQFRRQPPPSRGQPPQRTSSSLL